MNVVKHLVGEQSRGFFTLAEVPAPRATPRSVLVRTLVSVISSGTERAMVGFAGSNLLAKARQRPDLVRQVIERARSEGWRTTYRAAMTRLGVPLPLGYSLAGEVIEVGEGVQGLRSGDRVACAGAGYASHAELALVPKNLVVRVPPTVTDEDAAFSTLGAVALQGIRVCDVRLGERVVVIGLGILGLLSVQLLKAAGCQVLATDLNEQRVHVAGDLGADRALLLEALTLHEAVLGFTEGRGADAVIITAATKSNEPVELAGRIARLKGRVVVVGDVRMDVPRRVYYEKELELRVSRSYGPGRYDPNYEEQGIDYPYAYVPFTEQRNMETFLSLVAQGKVTPSRLITHRFPIEQARQAYALLRGKLGESYLAIALTYPNEPSKKRIIEINTPRAQSVPGQIGVALVGAGNYTRLTLLPALTRVKGVRLIAVSSARGLSAWDLARRYGFERASTDNEAITQDDRVQAILISTRHDSHAQLVAEALMAGKHVFVEKPLATTEEALRDLVEIAQRSSGYLMVGFNRRFAPLAQRAKAILKNRVQPLAMVYRINAGAVPPEHWTQDPQQGAGRIIGEVCHFVDFLQYLCGSPPVSVYAASIGRPAGAVPAEDVVSVTLRFQDGSIGSIHYYANGDRAIPKEYIELYTQGTTLILDDFRSLRLARAGRIYRWDLRGQDKGHAAELQAFFDAVRSGSPTPIPLDEAVITTITTFRTLDSLRLGREVGVGWATGTV